MDVVGLSGDDKFRRRIRALSPPPPEPDPPRFGACVYCGLPSGYSLACGAHLRILALDPAYSDSAARMRESDVLPETDEDGR